MLVRVSASFSENDEVLERLRMGGLRFGLLAVGDDLDETFILTRKI